MKSSNILLLASTLVLLVIAGWECMQMILVLVVGPAILVEGVVYVVRKLAVFRSFRSAISSILLRMPMALGFFLIVGFCVGVIAAIVMSLRGFVPPSESWLYVSLGFVAGAMGVVEDIKKSKNKPQQSSIVNRQSNRMTKVYRPEN